MSKGSQWQDQSTTLEVLDRSPAKGAARAERWFVLVRWPESEPRLLELRRDKPLLVGRQGDAAISCPFSSVSRRHAELRLDGPAPLLVDLGSRNGCRHNDQKLAANGRVSLAAGDVVAVGPVLLTLTNAAAEAPPVPQGVVAQSPGLKATLDLARRVARLNTTVLLHGETGSGKEVVAETIHKLSPRREGPFVQLSCASLPEPLLEAELFGHEKGAFTGAERQRRGFFEAANGGTLFLDEIGELPPATQAKLLVVLESRQVVRLGSSTPLPVDVRVVSATHRSLPEEMARGRFREDLYYRLSAFTIEIPPLRERREDVMPLAELFLARTAAAVGEPAPAISDAAREALLAHAWPGNVRELRNAMEHAFVLAEGALQPAHLPAAVRAPPPRRPAPPLAAPAGSADPGDLKADLDALEREAVERALASCGGNQTKAAQQLGISRRGLIHKMEKYGLKKKD